MTDTESLPEVDEVVEVLTTALPADPSPSTIREHRTACEDARRLLEADPTLAHSLAVPLATTLRDDLSHRAVADASAMYGIDLFTREAATAAASALEAIPIWRLVDTDALEPFLAAVAAVTVTHTQGHGRDAAATTLERASVFAPTAATTVLEDTGLGDDLVDAVTPLPDPTSLDATTARILVALVHTDQRQALPSLEPLLEHADNDPDASRDPAVTTRLAVLDATTPSQASRISNADDAGAGPIDRLRSLDPPADDTDSRPDRTETVRDLATTPSRAESGVDEGERDSDGQTVTPPRRAGSLPLASGEDRPPRKDDQGDDSATGADEHAPSDPDSDRSPTRRESPETTTEDFNVGPGSESELPDDHDQDPGNTTGRSSSFNGEPSPTTEDEADSSLDVGTILEPLTHVVASDRASTATRSAAFDALLAATDATSHDTDATSQDVFHALGVLASLDVLTPAARDRLRKTVVDHLVDGGFFNARATRGRRVASMEQTDVRPAALAAPDQRPPVTPLLLETDLLTESDHEHVAETVVDGIVDDARSRGEQRRLGWLHVHAGVPEPPVARLRSTLVERLQGDEDDRDWALDTIVGLAGYGLLAPDVAPAVLDATVDQVTAPVEGTVNETAGRAISALLTASELRPEHVNRLVARLPALLEADCIPGAQTGARVCAALAATGRLPADRVSDVLGIITQLCTVTQGGVKSVSLRVAAIHAVQALATNYEVPEGYREDVLGTLSIAARGDERHVDQSRRAALEGYRVISDEMSVPDVDAEIILPVVETALVQLLPDDRGSEGQRYGVGARPPRSRFTNRAAETLRDMVDNGFVDAELFAGVLAIEAVDATWLKNYSPGVIRADQTPQLGRFLAPDNPAVPPLLAAVASATMNAPGAFERTRPTLETFLARTDPNPEVTAGVLDVLSRLPTARATASPRLR